MALRVPDGMKRRIRRHVYPAVEWLWASGYGVVGTLRPADQSVRKWSSGGNERVVIVATHPDDETLGAGGTALLHRRAGDHVSVVVVTDGRASRAGGLAADEMARRRAEEMREAATLLGVDELACLRLPEGGWEREDAAGRLATRLETADIIYAPSCVDFHPEHTRVAAVIAGILREGQLVRVYEIGVPLTAVLVNLLSDITDVAMTKRRALAAFSTQADALGAPSRSSRYNARRWGLSNVEVFWEMTATAYTRIMSDMSLHDKYRGLRAQPFTDPLAALAGRRARRSLRAEVAIADSRAVLVQR